MRSRNARFGRPILSASLALFLALVAAPLAVDAITIAVVGDWTQTLGALDLVAGPGSDFPAAVESNSDQGAISIGGAAGSWRVDVKKTDSVWHGDLALEVRRTSDGTGSGSISGGLSYLEVTGLDTTFFQGDADRSAVDVQLRISGVSAALGVATFATTVTYTVVDL